MTEWTRLFDQRGMQARLAREFRLTRQAINRWKKTAQVPSEHAARFEELTGVPREVSCTDFNWGRSPRRAKQKQEA